MRLELSEPGVDIVFNLSTLVLKMRTTNLPLYLTKSKLRGRLLALFFLNPENSYFLRELERKLEASPGALARELKTLSEEGLLKRVPRGKQVFYQIHSTHPLFHEIKGIIEKTAGIPKTLSEGLKPLEEIRGAYLYGSVVTGQMEAHSDIDLLLIGKETDTVLKLLQDLRSKFGRPINSVTYAPEEFDRKRKDRSEFLYSLMKSPLIQLKP